MLFLIAEMGKGFGSTTLFLSASNIFPLPFGAVESKNIMDLKEFASKEAIMEGRGEA